MKLEPVAWVDQEKISALYDKRVSGIGAVLHKCSGSPSHKPLYVIPPGYVLVPVEQVLSAADVEIILEWMRGAQQEYCENASANENALEGKLRAMIEGEQ